MPLMAYSKSLLLFAFYALVAFLGLYLGLGYAGFSIIAPVSCAIRRMKFEGSCYDATRPLSISTSGVDNKAPAQVERVCVCALNRERDWLAQSENQTLMTTNLLLVCPHVADAMLGKQQMSFAWQIRHYVDFQLHQPYDERVHWMFFLKDHEMLFSHTPRSLKKFLRSAPTDIEIVSFEHSSGQQALGLFAIRLDDWTFRLLDSVLQLCEDRPDLTETEAMTIALALPNNARNVAFVPQWWLEVRSNCLERATWEAQFGVQHVVKTDQLCCVSSSCHDALGRIADQNEEASNQIVNSQEILGIHLVSSIEHNIEDFWTG